MIEDFIDAHLCKPCVILRSRVYMSVYVLIKDTSRRVPLAPLTATSIAINSTKVNILRGSKTFRRPYDTRRKA